MTGQAITLGLRGRGTAGTGTDRLLAVLLALALALSWAVAFSPTEADAAQPSNAPPNSGPVNLQTGYPFWYTDRTGLRLDLCLDAGVDAGGLCIAGLPNPGAPASVPDNYPAGDGEAFYWAGDAAMDLPAINERADTRLVLAMEAAFMNDAVAPWEQMTFGRVRIDADDLVPNETYNFVHPYGTETLTADDRGRIRYTEDIGGFNPPSDFTEALTSRPALGFLRWDPAVEPAPPAGHIGTLTPHTVVGSPFNTNYFEIQGPGLGEAGASGTQRTLDFEIQGRHWAAPAGGRLGLDHPTNVVDFGRQLAEGAPLTATAVLTNVGQDPLTISDLAIEDTPAETEPFAIVAENCDVLAPETPDSPPGTCTVELRFDGAAAGLANGDVVGNLVVTSDDAAFATQTVRLTAAFGPQPQIQGPIDPDTGFPLWYEDSNGVRLDLCQDQGIGNGGVCLAELRNPGAPPKVPENWAIVRNPNGTIADEPESFWWSADADLEDDIPGAERARLVLGLEATFGGDESVVMGNQNAFGRVRIQFRGLQPNADFEVTHPYGVETLGTDGDGEINVTRDVGCFVAPCDFNLPLTAETWPFLTAVAPVPPAGTVGNPDAAQTVTGSPIGQNLFRIEGPGIPGGAVQTEQFAVQGRRWVPPAAPTVAIDGRFGEVAFGNQTLNNAERTLTLTNAGAQALNITGLRMVGRNAADFTLGATSCPGLAAGTDTDPAGTCEVLVTFSAQSRGVKEAAIEVTSNDPMSPQLIRVSGNALDPTLPDVPPDTTPPTNVQFVGGPADGGTYVEGAVPPPPTCTADFGPGDSGTCVVTGYSSAVGTHTMTATATDLAGNTATAIRTYTVTPAPTPVCPTGGVPITGDWDGNGEVTPGWYNAGRVCLTNSNAAGAPVIQFTYGRAGDVPVVGDWNNNNTDTIGIRRGATWHLRNTNTAGAADLTFNYGVAGDIPVVGNWNGTGPDTVGIVRGRDWHLRNSNTAGAANLTFRYGRADQGDIPVTGNWNGTGPDTVGIVRGREWHLRNSNTAGGADLQFNYGLATDRFVTGDWNGNGQDTVGVVRNRTWHLRNTNNGGAANISFDF